jgi:hypothetical protein
MMNTLIGWEQINLSETVPYARGGRISCLRMCKGTEKARTYYFRAKLHGDDAPDEELAWFASTTFSAVAKFGCDADGYGLFGAVDFSNEQRVGPIRKFISEWLPQGHDLAIFQLFAPISFVKLLDVFGNKGIPAKIRMSEESRFNFASLLSIRNEVHAMEDLDYIRAIGCNIANDLISNGNSFESIASMVPGLDPRLNSAISDRVDYLGKLLDVGSRRVPIPIQGLLICGPPGVGKSSTLKRILNVVRSHYGNSAVYEKLSGGSTFFNGMSAGARLIVYDEFNPRESCSFSSLVRLLSCHDIVGFNCKGGYVNQSDLVGIIIVSNFSLKQLYARARVKDIDFEALQRRFLQLNIGLPDETFLTSFGIPNFLFTEVILGELISDWVCDVLKENLPAQQLFKRSWEFNNSPSVDSLENRTRCKLMDQFPSFSSNPRQTMAIEIPDNVAIFENSLVEKRCLGDSPPYWSCCRILSPSRRTLKNQYEKFQQDTSAPTPCAGLDI